MPFCWSCVAHSDAKPKRLKGMQRCSQSATNLRDASTLACHHIRVSRLFIPDGDDFFTSPWRLTGVIWQRGARFQPTVAQGRQAFANLLLFVRASRFAFCCREPKSADVQGIDFVSGGEFVFGVPWGLIGVYPKFDLTRFFPYVLLMTYPKINSLGPLVSEI